MYQRSVRKSHQGPQSAMRRLVRSWFQFLYKTNSANFFFSQRSCSAPKMVQWAKISGHLTHFCPSLKQKTTIFPGARDPNPCYSTYKAMHSFLLLSPFWWGRSLSWISLMRLWSKWLQKTDISSASSVIWCVSLGNVNAASILVCMHACMHACM